MDINDMRGIATILTMVAFLAVTFWAYSSKKKKDFSEAANLPFADEKLDVPKNNTDTQSVDTQQRGSQ